MFYFFKRETPVRSTRLYDWVDALGPEGRIQQVADGAAITRMQGDEFFSLDAYANQMLILDLHARITALESQIADLTRSGT